MHDNAGSSIAVLVDRRTGDEFNICRYSTSLGRDLGCDLVLNTDKTVSRQHALIQFIDGKFHVQDLSSKNGTRLNGTRVTNLTLLRSGDEISLGLTQMVFILIPQHSLACTIPGTITQAEADPVPVPPAMVAV